MMQIGASTSNLYQSYLNQQKAMMRIATAQRINNASDDAAGQAISTVMNAQANGLNQASINAQNSSSLLNTAENAMSGSSEILQRMRVLNLQASNGTMTDQDRVIAQQETSQLNDQLNFTASTTEFNTIKTNNGSLSNFITHIGANSGQTMTTAIGDTSSKALGINTNVSTQAAAENGLQSIDNAIESLSSSQAKIGAVTNRLQYSSQNAEQSAINTEAAQSTISDADMSQEFSLFNQSSVNMYTAIMALKNTMQMGQSSLSLLA